MKTTSLPFLPRIPLQCTQKKGKKVRDFLLKISPKIIKLISVFLNRTLKNKVIVAKVRQKILSRSMAKMILCLIQKMEEAAEEESRKFPEWHSSSKRMKNRKRPHNFRLIRSSNFRSSKDLSWLTSNFILRTQLLSSQRDQMTVDTQI